MARIIQQNATDVSVAVRVFTAAGAPVNITHAEAGLAFQAKLGALRDSAVNISPVSRTNDVAAHADGGFVAVGTGFGEHRLDLPDTCSASLGPVALSGKTTAGHIFVFEDLTVVPFNPSDANPEVRIKSGTGAGELTTSGGKVAATVAAADFAPGAAEAIAAEVLTAAEAAPIHASVQALSSAVQSVLVRAVVRAMNGLDGYGFERDEATNTIRITIPGVGVVTAPAVFADAAKAVTKVGS